MSMKPEDIQEAFTKLANEVTPKDAHALAVKISDLVEEENIADCDKHLAVACAFLFGLGYTENQEFARIGVNVYMELGSRLINIIAEKIEREGKEVN